jgi:hypothetical protein
VDWTPVYVESVAAFVRTFPSNPRSKTTSS